MVANLPQELLQMVSFKYLVIVQIPSDLGHSPKQANKQMKHVLTFRELQSLGLEYVQNQDLGI